MTLVTVLILILGMILGGVPMFYLGRYMGGRIK